jgi:hypothetical protein
VNDIKEGVSEGKGAKETLANVGGRMASSVVPQIVQQAAATFDPLKRDTSGDALGPIKNAIPIVRETLPPKMNQRGRGIPETKNFYDPTQTRTPGDVPLSPQERIKALQLQKQKEREKRQKANDTRRMNRAVPAP